MENKELQEGCSRFKIENYRTNAHVNTITLVPSDPNEAMRFDNKTDRDIIYNSGFKTLRPIEHLLVNAMGSRPAIRRNKKGKIPRPQNSWIIYRRDKSADPKFKGLQPEIIAKEISKMWGKEPEEVKGFYAALSREAGRLHKQKHENYRYQPGPYNKKTNKNKSSKKSKENKPNNTQATVTPSPAVQQLLTPVTTTSSPVLEEQLPQNFPNLYEIHPELPPTELQQQLLLTPASITYSSASSEDLELNFAEFFTLPSPNTPNIVTPELEVLGQQFLEAATSPFDSTYAQYNNALSQYNDGGDFVLYDNADTPVLQEYDNSHQMNFFEEISDATNDIGMAVQQYDNSQTYQGVFDNGVAVQQQCDNSQNFYEGTNMIDEQVFVNNTTEQNFEILWNSFNEQQRQLLLNILDSNLFKKSE